MKSTMEVLKKKKQLQRMCPFGQCQLTKPHKQPQLPPPQENKAKITFIFVLRHEDNLCDNVWGSDGLRSSEVEHYNFACSFAERKH